MSIETVVAQTSCRETEKRFTTMVFFSGFLEQLLLGKMVMMGNVHLAFSEYMNFRNQNYTFFIQAPVVY